MGGLNDTRCNIGDFGVFGVLADGCNEYRRVP
jgi:hypothetical protein